jgi:hypothetical protein
MRGYEDIDFFVFNDFEQLFLGLGLDVCGY